MSPLPKTSLFAMVSSLPTTVCKQFNGRSSTLVGDAVGKEVLGDMNDSVVGLLVVGGGD